MASNTSFNNNVIGHQILKEMIDQGITVSQFAEMISTSRTNVYHVIQRSSFNCDLLYRISVALNHNFFKDLSADVDEQITTTSTH